MAPHSDREVSDDDEPDKVLLRGTWVPMLKGASNYKEWRARFEEAMKTKEPRLWRILTSEICDPSDVIQSALNDLADPKSMRTFIAKETGTETEDVSEENIKDVIKRVATFTEAKELKRMNDKVSDEYTIDHNLARDLLLSTVSYNSCNLEFVDRHCFYYAPEVLEWLHFKYSEEGHMAKMNVWNRWQSLRYQENDGVSEDLKGFVCRFKKAQKELEELTGQSIRPQHEICQFTSALGDRDDDMLRYRFTMQASHAMKASETGESVDMVKVYRRFLFLDPEDSLEW